MSIIITVTITVKGSGESVTLPSGGKLVYTA